MILRLLRGRWMTVAWRSQRKLSVYWTVAWPLEATGSLTGCLHCLYVFGLRHLWSDPVTVP